MTWFFHKFSINHDHDGARGDAVAWGIALQAGRSRVRFPMVSMTYSFRPHYGPGIDSASGRNEYQEYFVGVKAVGAYGWQPCHLHLPIVMMSGSLNLLELSGLSRSGIALPLCDHGTVFYCKMLLLVSFNFLIF